MRYQKQQIDILLTTGIGQESDPKVAPAQRLLACTNLEYTLRGRLQKVGGWAPTTLTTTSGGAVSGTALRIAAYGDRVVYCTTTKLYDYSPVTAKCSERCTVPIAGFPTKRMVARDTRSNHVYSAGCECNGYRVYCWVVEDSTFGGGSGYTPTGKGELWAAVYTSDGQLLFRERLASVNATRPRLFEVRADATVVLWWLVQDAGAPFDLKYATLTCSAPPTAWSAATVYAANVDVNLQYDACAVDTVTGVNAVAYYDGVNLKVFRNDIAFASTHNINIAEVASSAVCVYSDGTNVCVGWSNATPLTRGSIRLAADLTSVVAPMTLQAYESDSFGWVAQSTTIYWYVLGQRETMASYFAYVPRTQTGLLTTGATNTLSTTPFYHLKPASRPIFHGGRCYGLAVNPANSTILEQGLYLVQWPGGNPLANYPRLHCVLTTGGMAMWTTLAGYVLVVEKPGELHAIDANTFLGVWGEYYRYPVSGATSGGVLYAIGQAGTAAWEMDFADPAHLQAVELDNSLYVSGGVVSQYDGDQMAECGYAWAPSMSTAVVTAGANTWSYVFTYIWLDKNGKLHESAPGKAIQKTAATIPVTLRVQCLTLTNKYDAALVTGQTVGIRVYRTLNNETTFRWIGDFWNEVGSAYKSITDNVSDADLATQPVIYTDGGGLPNGQPLAASHVAVWDNRVVSAAGQIAQFTKRPTAERPPMFADHESHTIAIRGNQSIVGAFALDDALGLLTDQQCFATQGQGPGENGTPLLPEPRQVASVYGCVNARTIINLPDGLMYQSERGLEILPRGFGSPKWLGEAIATELVGMTLTGAALRSSESQVWFAFYGGGDSYALIYDYLTDAWSRRSFDSVGEANAGIAFAGDAMRLAPVTAGTLWSFADTTGDVSVHVESSFQTQRLRAGGLTTGVSRWDRVRIQGELRGPCKIYLYVADNDGAEGTPIVWTLTGATGTPIILEHKFAVAKARSKQLRIVDAGIPAGELLNPPTLGMWFNSFTIDVATRKNAQAQPAALRR